MKPIDTHAHLQFEKFDMDQEDVIKRNSEQLDAIINPGADLISSEKAIALANKVSNFYAAVGVHPHHVDNWDNNYLTKLEKLIHAEKVVAIGEIGLDKYQYTGYPKSDITKQTKILIPQLELAIKYKKPILFHCRDAYDELYSVIKHYQPLKGLVHCFMGDERLASKFVELGLLISFAGNLTYKNNDHMRLAAKTLDESKVLIETDSPYLAPEPLRGQRNEPINILLVAQEIAKQRKVSLEQIVSITSNNARKLFDI